MIDPPPPPPPLPPPPPSCRPPPPPGLTPSHAAPVKGPRPQAPMKRLQWVKIPEVKVKNSDNNLWTNAGRMFPALSVNFDRIEQLFSCRSLNNNNNHNHNGNINNNNSSSNGYSGSNHHHYLGFPGDRWSGDPNDQSAFDSTWEVHGQSPWQRHGNDPSANSTDGFSGSSEKKRKQEEVNLLDPKRSMNVNIFIRQLRLSNLELIEKLRQCDTKSFDVETLKTLSRLLPEEGDMAALTAYRGDPRLLGTAEKFYFALMSLPDFDLIIQTLLVKEEFYQSLDTLKPAIDSVIHCSRAVKESRAFHEIVQLVLTVGNFLNAGAYSGDAAGFKLSSLLQLGEIKANNDSKLHLMHYVAEEAEAMDLVSQLEELKFLSNDCMHNVPSLHSDIRNLRETFSSNVARLTSSSSSSSSSSDQGTLRRLKSMEEAIDSEMKILETEARDVESLRLELAEYFCEDEAAFKLDECLNVVNSFCKSFLAAHEENKERKLQAERAEMKRLERQKSLQRRLSSASGPSPTPFGQSERNGPTADGQHLLQQPPPQNGLSPNRNHQIQSRSRSASCTRGPATEGYNGAASDVEGSNLLEDVLLRPSTSGDCGFDGRKFNSLRANRRRSRNSADLWNRERFSSPLSVESNGNCASPGNLDPSEAGGRGRDGEKSLDESQAASGGNLVRNGFARSSCPSRVQVSERQQQQQLLLLKKKNHPIKSLRNGEANDDDEADSRAADPQSAVRKKADLDRRLSREVAMGAASVEQQIRQLQTSLNCFERDYELDWKTLSNNGNNSSSSGGSGYGNNSSFHGRHHVFSTSNESHRTPKIKLSSPEKLDVNQSRKGGTNGISTDRCAEQEAESNRSGSNIRERMKKLTQLYSGGEMEVQLNKPSNYGKEVNAPADPVGQRDQAPSRELRQASYHYHHHQHHFNNPGHNGDKHFPEMNFKDEGFDSEGFSNTSASQKSSRSSSRDRDSAAGQVDWNFAKFGGEETTTTTTMPLPHLVSRPDDNSSAVSGNHHHFFDRSIESLVAKEMTLADCTGINESLSKNAQDAKKKADTSAGKKFNQISNKHSSKTTITSKNNNNNNNNNRVKSTTNTIKTPNLSFGSKLSNLVSRAASKPASRVTPLADSKKTTDNKNDAKRQPESNDTKAPAAPKSRSLSRQAQDAAKKTQRDSSAKSTTKTKLPSRASPKSSPRSASAMGTRTPKGTSSLLRPSEPYCLAPKVPSAGSTSSSLSSDAGGKFSHVSRDTRPKGNQPGILSATKMSSRVAPFSTPPSAPSTLIRKPRTPSSGTTTPSLRAKESPNFVRQSAGRSTLPGKLYGTLPRSYDRQPVADLKPLEVSILPKLIRPVKPNVGSTASTQNTPTRRQQNATTAVKL